MLHKYLPKNSVLGMGGFKILFLVLCCLIAGGGSLSAIPKLKSTWNLTRHIPIDQVIIQSHRGAGELCEENTIEAFMLSWNLGFIPEADIRTTKDGVIIPFHDKTFKRLVKDASSELKKKGPKDITYKYLSTLDVGSWKGDAFKGRRVPTIKQVFQLMRERPDRRIYLDYKDVDLSQLAAEVRAAGVEKQVILASRHPHIHKEWSNLVPGSRGLLWMPGNEVQINEIISTLEAGGFPGISQVQLHVRKNEKANSSEPYNHSRLFILELGNRLRAKGILYQALPWRGEEQVYFDLLDLGVASFATDNPDMVQDVLKEYYYLHEKDMRGTKK